MVSLKCGKQDDLMKMRWVVVVGGILKRDENREVWKDFRVALRTGDQGFVVAQVYLPVVSVAPLGARSHSVQVQKPSDRIDPE